MNKHWLYRFIKVCKQKILNRCCCKNELRQLNIHFLNSYMLLIVMYRLLLPHRDKKTNQYKDSMIYEYAIGVVEAQIVFFLVQSSSTWWILLLNEKKFLDFIISGHYFLIYDFNLILYPIINSRCYNYRYINTEIPSDVLNVRFAWISTVTTYIAVGLNYKFLMFRV